MTLLAEPPGWSLEPAGDGGPRWMVVAAPAMGQGPYRTRGTGRLVPHHHYSAAPAAAALWRGVIGVLTESEARAGPKGRKGSSPFPSATSHIVVIQLSAPRPHAAYSRRWRNWQTRGA